MADQLKGRTALVTGASRGIGRAVALALAAEQVTTVLVARSEPELEETARLVRDAGGHAVPLQADLSDDGQREELARRALEVVAELSGERSGGVDILVNNAAVALPVGPSVSVSPAAWAAALALNVTAPATLTFALLPAMLERGWGRVVNVSSGVVGVPGLMIGGNAYTTGKAALEAHTVNLAAELAGSGVTANVYRPGTVDTAMQAWIRDQPPEEIGAALHDHFTRLHEQGALITPEASARSLVARLGGNATGQVWDVKDPL